jgi:hypothetical protein
MKKTKTILALVSALALLLVAACEQGLEPTPPELGNFHDSRTNQNYTDDIVKGSSYFPAIGAVNTDPAALIVKIDFETAVKHAKDNNRTLDVLKENVEENIKKAIIFQGVTWPSDSDANGINDYQDLAYDVTAVDRMIVYVKLPALTAYHQVRPYIKASEYKVSGKPIDTDSNYLGGESPYDDKYFVVIDIGGADKTGKASKPPTALETRHFSLNTFGEHSKSTDDSVFILAASYSGFTDDKVSYTEKLKERLVLEKWNASAKTWETASFSGNYSTAGDLAGNYYFNITYGDGANTYEKYRVVAVDLYKFETETIQGFKRRFTQYPGTSVSVTAKDGRKVVGTPFPVRGSTHKESHRISGSFIYYDPDDPEDPDAPKVYTDEQAKNALLVLNLNTTKGGPLGNLGLKTLPADFNANFKLAYQTNSDDVSDPTNALAVFEFIGIDKYELRQKPGTTADAEGGIKQQLVLTLDPGYVWQNSRKVYVLARDGIKFAGDDVKVEDNRKPEGSLGDEKGTINIDGKYDWGYYGSFTATAKVNEE